MKLYDLRKNWKKNFFKLWNYTNWNKIPKFCKLDNFKNHKFVKIVNPSYTVCHQIRKLLQNYTVTKIHVNHNVKKPSLKSIRRQDSSYFWAFLTYITYSAKFFSLPAKIFSSLLKKSTDSPSRHFHPLPRLIYAHTRHTENTDLVDYSSRPPKRQNLTLVDPPKMEITNYMTQLVTGDMPVSRRDDTSPPPIPPLLPPKSDLTAG